MVAIAMLIFSLGEYAALVTLPHILSLALTSHGLAQPPINASPSIIRPTSFLVMPSERIL